MSALKGEATRCWSKRDYLKSLQLFGDAAKALARADPANAELVDLHCNRASCFMQLRK